MSDTR